MPKEGSLVKFQDGQYQFKVPFFMYAYFEVILKPIESPKPNPESSYTKVINQHSLMERLRIHWNFIEVRIA